jgi:hypothetical protein
MLSGWAALTWVAAAVVWVLVVVGILAYVERKDGPR